MTHLLTVFAASYVFVALKAVQQRHVQHNDWWHVMPTSLCMATVEYYVIAQVIRSGYGPGLVLAGGLGAGLGAMSAMWLHNLHLQRKSK